MARILFLVVITIGIGLFGLNACRAAPPEGETMKNIENTQETTSAVPAMDAAAPINFETATFALG